MAQLRPKPISPSEQTARKRRITRIARYIGFVGGIEYRHVYSQSGGAQYGLASKEQDDLLTVYAEAFDRDADIDDFSLDSIIAHERGHQLLARHPRLLRNLPNSWSKVTEEIAASLLGSLLVKDERDQQSLVLKALYDSIQQGLEAEQATTLIAELRGLLEKLL